MPIDSTAASVDSPSMLGAYGTWAASLLPQEFPNFSFRHTHWTDIDSWRTQARQRFFERLAMPHTGGVPVARVDRRYRYDGLQVEELSWQLPYGPRTQALLLKPADSTEKLPGIVALHDHGGNKFFGWQKITRTREEVHPNLVNHLSYYEDVGWANEIAKQGYVVLVPDAFGFGSRRVRLADVPEAIRDGLDDRGWASNLLDERLENVTAYNAWAADHESAMAKSLFSAGTTWPGVWLSEDLQALDVLCARDDVDAERVGCGGLSGGGMRTVFLAGADTRIRCAVCVGMMTTWRDYLLHKSHTHTWMVYVPLLPNELDYPEILGLRVPLPTLVLNDIEDPLFTLAEMERADSMLQSIYERADASDAYRCSYYPGGHKFDLAMQAEAFSWFDRWLG